MEQIALPTADAWYLPGGKINDVESSLEALQREILEELSIMLDSEPYPETLTIDSVVAVR